MKKLRLNKEVISRLNDDEMNRIRGGAHTDVSCNTANTCGLCMSDGCGGTDPTGACPSANYEICPSDACSGAPNTKRSKCFCDMENDGRYSDKC